MNGKGLSALFLSLLQMTHIYQSSKTKISIILWTEVKISRMICDPIPATCVTQNLEFVSALWFFCEKDGGNMLEDEDFDRTITAQINRDKLI